MKKNILLWLSVCTVLGTVGCSTSKVPQIEAKYYPECYDPIAKLCKDEDNSDEIKSAAVGGVIGAIGGALIGGLASKDKKGALIGAAVGAVAGAATGFFKARLDKINDRDQRLAEYQKILGDVSSQWDLRKSSVEVALDCYDKQITVLENLVRDKKISEKEFLERMNEIKQGLDNIKTYWADATTNVNADLADGEKFLEEEERRIAEEEKAKQIKAQEAKKQREKLRKQKLASQKQKKKVQQDNEKVSAKANEVYARIRMINLENKGKAGTKSAKVDVVLDNYSLYAITK